MTQYFLNSVMSQYAKLLFFYAKKKTKILVFAHTRLVYNNCSVLIFGDFLMFAWLRKNQYVQGIYKNILFMNGELPLSIYAKLSENLTFLTPLIRKRTYTYQGVRNVGFSENFAYVLNG